MIKQNKKNSVLMEVNIKTISIFKFIVAIKINIILRCFILK
jgi:hypothetical protein